MKWAKAIRLIEWALAQGHDVEIRYHRKWMPNDTHYDTVSYLPRYDWNGQECRAITTFHDQIDGSTHIVDDVRIKEA